MPSVVDIANLALAHLGDEATVSSISPPEGSAQAEHVERFYPIARDTLLQSHPWAFALTTQPLAELRTVSDTARHYAFPAKALQIIDVQDAQGRSVAFDCVSEVSVEAGRQPVIVTNAPSARAQYVALIEDPTQFSALFVTALTWQLAAYLAGPLIKGDAGRAEAKRCMQMAAMWLNEAKRADANQSRIALPHAVPDWIKAR